jgi:hypothetical protein
MGFHSSPLHFQLPHLYLTKLRFDAVLNRLKLLNSLLLFRDFICGLCLAHSIELNGPQYFSLCLWNDRRRRLFGFELRRSGG